jgi:HEAT repeat protein
MQNSKINFSKLTRVVVVLLIFAASALLPFVTSLAQRRSKQTPPKVTGISTKKTAGGEVISLAADAPLNGVQTWQDPNGTFHLILPNSGESTVKGMPSGVKVRRVGNSLEVEVPAKRGANVTVQPRFNRLDLVVNGGLEDRQSTSEGDYVAPEKSSASREQSRQMAAVPSVRAARETRSTKSALPLDPFGLSQPLPTAANDKTNAQAPVSATTNVASMMPAQAASAPAEPVNSPNNSNAAPQEAPAPAVAEEESGIASYIFFSGWWITALLIVGLVGLVLWRRKEKESGWEDVEKEGVTITETAITPAVAAAPNPDAINAIVGDRRVGDRRLGRRRGGRRSSDTKASKSSAMQVAEPHEQVLEPRVVSPAPIALYGAYRVDQEVGKLVLGQPHRMDVLASRAADDRRAMESSLLKALRAKETDEDGRRRACQALEEYGFLARQSAALLLAQDPCERAAAARMLGEVGASSSLPFLLEALYDAEVIVRTQAVESIGALKLPSAIGALLDIARRYPDMPNSLLSSALNACSIDALDFFDSTPAQPALLSHGADEPFINEQTKLEPSATFEHLPETSDEETLIDALAHLQSGDAEARQSAAQTLALYRVQRAVSALKLMAGSDAEPAVRATAVASLGAIDHESVFGAVLVALADEARDVRAAAARALSRLSFDRAEAYVRVIETADAEELTEAARACIKTGMAAQALDRLASDDRRQAYEAFSLLSLLAKANEVHPILEAIERHADVNVRLIAVQLLGVSGQPEFAKPLRHLAVCEGMPEQVRTALLEAVYKIDQMLPV